MRGPIPGGAQLQLTGKRHQTTSNSVTGLDEVEVEGRRQGGRRAQLDEFSGHSETCQPCPDDDAVKWRGKERGGGRSVGLSRLSNYDVLRRRRKDREGRRGARHEMLLDERARKEEGEGVLGQWDTQ